MPRSRSRGTKITIDREGLLQVRDTGAIKDFNAAEHGFPDLVKGEFRDPALKSSKMMANFSPTSKTNADSQNPKAMALPIYKQPTLMHQLSEADAVDLINFGGCGDMIRPPTANGPPILPLPPHRGEVRTQLDMSGNGLMAKTAPAAALNPEEEALITKSTYKKSRNLFNKLTPDNFDSLVPLFLSLPLGDNDERILNFVTVMFEKAVERPSSSPVYGRMLKFIGKSTPGLSDLFAEKIRHHLHNEFGQSMRDRKELRKSNREEDNALNVKRALDVTKFIGELYGMQILTPKILVGRVNSLLNGFSDEVNLKCLCVLLTTVGQSLSQDLKTLEKTIPNCDEPRLWWAFVPEPNWMGNVFERLQGYLNQRTMSAGLRYSISEVIQLWKSNWRRSDDKKVGMNASPSLASSFRTGTPAPATTHYNFTNFIQEAYRGNSSSTASTSFSHPTMAFGSFAAATATPFPVNGPQDLANRRFQPPSQVQPVFMRPLQQMQLPPQHEESKSKTENGMSTCTPEVVGDPETEILITRSICQRTRDLLNKLTRDNFPTLESSFLALPLENKDDRISGFISVMFEYALEKASFSSIYADILQIICNASPDNDASSVLFTKHILRLSNKKFVEMAKLKKEIRTVEPTLANTKNYEKLMQIQEKKTFVKKTSLANVRFLCELYKVDILAPKMVVGRVNALLNAGADEDNFRCLCSLLTHVGEKLTQDLQQLAETASEGWDGVSFIPDLKWMDGVFIKLKSFLSNTPVSFKLQTPISNLIELRKNWKKTKHQSKINQTNGHSTTTTTGPVPVSMSANEAAPTSTKGHSTIMEEQTSRSDSVTSTVTGLSCCEDVLDSEMKNAAVTLQRLSHQGVDADLEKRLGLLNYIRNLAQTMESMIAVRKAQFRMETSGPNGNATTCSSELSSGQNNQIPSSIDTREPSSSGSTGVNLKVEVDTTNDARTTLEAHNSTANVNETAEDTEDEINARNVFQEYLNCRDFDETFNLIKRRCLGNQMEEFVDKITRQVCESSKEVEQKLAANIVRFLIRKKEIKKKVVTEIMARGVMQDLPRILMTYPKAPANLSTFLAELFSEHTNLDWLLQVGDILKQAGDEGDAAWRLLVANYLNALKSRKDEEHVRITFRQTERNFAIPIDGIPWLENNAVDFLAERLFNGLQQNYDGTHKVQRVPDSS